MRRRLTLLFVVLTTPEEKEFFLLENRRKSHKWDSYLPGEGMLVYRVDHTNEEVWSLGSANGNKVNVAPAHNYYVLLQAGGEKYYVDSDDNFYSWKQTGSDPFPGDNCVHELTNSTSPANLKTWAGLPCDYELTNIQRAADATITFTATAYDHSQDPTGIISVAGGRKPSANSLRYNLAGQRVSDSYKGLVIQNRHKMLKK